MNPPVPVVAGSTDAGTGRRVIVAGSAVRLDSGLYADLSDRTGLSAPIVEAGAVRPRAWQAGGQPATRPPPAYPTCQTGPDDRPTPAPPSSWPMLAHALALLERWCARTTLAAVDLSESHCDAAGHDKSGAIERASAH